MNNLRKNISNAILITAFILVMFFLAGCGDSEMAREITDTVKRTVTGEVAKKGEEIKKQFDQIVDMGTGKSQKKDGQGAADVDQEKSERDSDKESEEEND